MFDLHCHLLPGDDGVADLGMALEMARIAVGDGIHTVACTPRIRPGTHDNPVPGIRAAIKALQAELDTRDIRLQLVEGADVHLEPGLAGGIRRGRIPTLAGSHYLLLEPSHEIVPPRLEQVMFELMTIGITPVVTHPERLLWIETHYDLLVRLAERGVWMQVTAGALTGHFGKRVQYWGERFVGEGHCQILATEADHPQRRPPLLAEARAAAVVLVGRDAAEHMVVTRPAGVIADADPSVLPPPLAAIKGVHPSASIRPDAQANPGNALLRILRGLRRRG
jgi:protein-tyrosine phosphatase